MQRNCSTCKKNNTQLEFGCPYINKEMECFYDFPLYGNPEFGIYGCPIYYFNEDNEILKLYNYIERGIVNKNELSYLGRYMYTVIKDFLELYKANENKT